MAIVESGTTANQRVLRGTLGQLNILAEAHKVEAPTILITGKVAALGEKIPWFGRTEPQLESGKVQRNSAIPEVASN